MIEVDSLRKAYGALVAVDGVTFSAQAGEIYGLLGPNGAGKSTTIGCMSGLLEADAGSVRVLGHDIAASARAARQSLGVVPQELALYDDLSATANLHYWGGRYGLALIQVGFALLIGRLVLGVDFGPEWPMLLATLAAYTALIASLALLAGNLATSEGQAVAIGVLGANVLGALGGCFWPIELTPVYVQQIVLFLPTGWMMDAMHKLMIFGRDWSTALPHLIGMSVAAWLLGVVAARRFRFE